jgi:hypothetical protein
MIAQDHQPKVVLNPRTIAESKVLREVFATLVHAATCAKDVGCDPWEYATEMETLLGVGLKPSDLRWLVNMGYVSNAIEVTRPQDTARRFQPCYNLSFNRRTCFVLTEAGMSLGAEGISQPPDFLSEGENSGQSHVASPHRSVPSWDPDRRVLRVDGRVVKRYKVPSPNQEAIIAAFAEEGWPTAIDDPLPPHPEQDSKRRLRKTLQSLNANQTQQLLRFRGDGTGERILWERIEDDSPQAVLKFGDRGCIA